MVALWCLRHGLRNALIPAVTVLGLQFGQLLSGAVITETIFSRLGIGRLYVEAILNKDFTMVQGITLIHRACLCTDQSAGGRVVCDHRSASQL